MNTKQRIEELTKQLNHYNYRYYVDHFSEVSDKEFDMMMQELQELERQYPEYAAPNSPTMRVGSDLQQEFKHVRHNIPMLSLSNAYSVDELLTWYDSVKAVYGKDVAIAYEPKYDGLSISLIYRFGKLAQAVTRGDGVQGDDVTENVKMIERVPLYIDQPDIKAQSRFEIRGEVLMPFESFAKLNKQREANGEEPFANPRNAAAGTLKSTRSKVVRERGLDVYLYEVPLRFTSKEWEQDQCDLMNYLFGKGVPTAQSFHVGYCVKDGNENYTIDTDCFDRERLEYAINDFVLRRPLMDYPIDGIVFKVANRRLRRQCGATSKAPKWAIAYKFNAERMITTVRDVTFQVGRTGQVTPVVHFDPIPLAGTLVRKATGNNADFLHEMHIAIGGQIEVEKGGEIIPKIVVGVDPCATKDFKEVTYPKYCPECGAPLVKDGSNYYCIGESCPAQLQARLEHFVSRDAMNIQGIGPKMIEEWINGGIVKDVADIYESERLETFFSTRIILSRAESKSVPAHRVLFALGIRYVGASTAKLLLKHCGSINALAAFATACPEQLIRIDGVGVSIVISLGQWFSDKKNLELLSRLQAIGLQMKEKIAHPSGTTQKPLAGLTIVISGVFEQHSRDEYRAMIEQYGGKNGSSVSKNTNYILAGDNMGPSKREKAEQLGIEIINEEQFLNMIENEKL
ncbi:MAG: NAD-dependent DNA ligase LigA [Bacteroidaceae bacterium]|nr:NAD-dependent DNA ligase LigA [Bacteroidaceae bacterium]